MAEAAAQPPIQFDPHVFHVQNLGLGRVSVSMRSEALSSLDLSAFEFGIAEYDHATKRVLLNGGWLDHHPNKFEVADTWVTVSAGDDEHPQWVWAEYRHNVGLTISPTTWGGAQPPPDEEGKTRIWLYRLYSTDAGVFHPPKKWVSRFVLVGSLFATG